ncbi:cobalt-precorrin-6A reductase [Roseovarius sp. SCSIO 43702]|uniref:cobalt-precorrin-6A reductase n=1 Tax=Roseovarius sp. SCSIO 43702 TaxID=2823043 RepID=UPI001C73A7A4|nr:cobalt-precorrin-6A reductase [Roseovarius sp. SCSIO 43702]QYX56582.1 cobalt-precorrin-6A reductase [Roseovarius sp. SCSIO 43702]
MSILVLGGTGEALKLAAVLAARGMPALLSLARRDRRAAETGLPVRTGGFGGGAGFRAFLCGQGIGAVMDATHPFAERITHRTVALCREAGVPYCRLERPEWTAGPGDRWTIVPDAEAAAGLIEPGEVAFLATGRESLGAFAGLRESVIHCRVLTPTDEPFPLPRGGFVHGTAPFSVEGERALFRALGVDWLILRNAGGEGPRAKLVAAREEGLRVAMIARSAPPDAPCVTSVDAAVNWLEGI